MPFTELNRSKSMFTITSCSGGHQRAVEPPFVISGRPSAPSVPLLYTPLETCLHRLTKMRTHASCTERFILAYTYSAINTVHKISQEVRENGETPADWRHTRLCIRHEQIAPTYTADWLQTGAVVYETSQKPVVMESSCGR